MEALVQTYGTALMGMTILALIMAVQSFISGLVKNAISGQPAGKIVAGDMSDSTFRIVRTHMNGVENFSAFFATVVLAMIVGVSAAWVNWIVLAYVVLRLIYWPVYTFNIHSGTRTILYVLGLVLNIILAIMVVLALL